MEKPIEQPTDKFDVGKTYNVIRSLSLKEFAELKWNHRETPRQKAFSNAFVWTTIIFCIGIILFSYGYDLIIN